MPDIGVEYSLLRQSVASDNQLSTRPLSVFSSAGAPLMVGLDHEGRKHLVIPLGSEEILSEDTRSQGVWLTEVTLVRDGETMRFASVQCREEHLDLVFERLVEDIVDRIAAGEPTSSAAHTALDEWRAMLRTGRSMSREEIVGLIGELEVLRHLGRTSPMAALAAWTGPRNTVHDFVHDGHGLEVKSTSSADGGHVSIHGLGQLDPHGMGSLHLVVVHCQEDSGGPSLDDRIRRLITDGFPREELLRTINRTGYIFEGGASHATRFQVRSIRLWTVEEDFPGLRQSTMPKAALNGISNVSYYLALAAAPEEVPEEIARQTLERWLLRAR